MLSTGCVSAHKPHLGYVQGNDGGHLQILLPPVLSLFLLLFRQVKSSGYTKRMRNLEERERGERCISHLFILYLVFDLSVFYGHEFVRLYVEPYIVSSIKGKQNSIL